MTWVKTAGMRSMDVRTEGEGASGPKRKVVEVLCPVVDERVAHLSDDCSGVLSL